MEEITGPETGEHGFRHGMREGWEIAAQTLRDLVDAGLSLEEALLAMGRILREGRLAAWRVGNCARYERPPELFLEEASALLIVPDQAEEDGEGEHKRYPIRSFARDASCQPRCPLVF